MKKILVDGIYWIAVVIILTAVIFSSGYTLGESFLMSLIFIPGCMILKFILPKVSFRNPREGLINLFFIMCAVSLSVLLMLMISHTQMYYADWRVVQRNIPSLLMNPLVVMLVMILLVAGNLGLMRLFRPVRELSGHPLTFVSDYKKVTLDTSEIIYIESRDTEVWVYATEGRQFRNKTGITQWENLLGEDFMRVHRSYVVRKADVSTVAVDFLTLSDGIDIPVSKKYRDSVSAYNFPYRDRCKVTEIDTK